MDTEVVFRPTIWFLIFLALLGRFLYDPPCLPHVKMAGFHWGNRSIDITAAIGHSFRAEDQTGHELHTVSRVDFLMRKGAKLGHFQQT